MEPVIFRLKKGKTPLTYTLNGGHNGRVTTIYKKKDEDGKDIEVRRAIRHVPSENSIFIDKQSEFAKKNAVSPIFKNGYMMVSASEKMTIDYMRSHYLNEKEYEEINTIKVAKESIERDELVTGLKHEVKEKGDLEDGKDHLEAIACVLSGSYMKTRNMVKEELKKEIYTHIDSNPYAFVDEYNNSIIFGPENMKRYFIHYAMNNNHIKVSENKKSWIWCNSGALISNIPSGIMPIDHFSEFLDTDEGMIVTRKLHDLTGDVVGSDKVKDPEKKKPGRPPKTEG